MGVVVPIARIAIIATVTEPASASGADPNTTAQGVRIAPQRTTRNRCFGAKKRLGMNVGGSHSDFECPQVHAQQAKAEKALYGEWYIGHSYTTLKGRGDHNEPGQMPFYITRSPYASHQSNPDSKSVFTPD